MAENNFITTEELYLFNHGEFYHSWLKFGAHRGELNNREGVHFVVWAPNAKQVNVVGDFNQWQGSGHRMERQGKSGVWHLFIAGLGEGQLYKYELETCGGDILLKADPYAFYAETRPNTASVVYKLEGYLWQDQDWTAKRVLDPGQEKPMLIYEVHLGSWRRNADHSFYSYRQLAEELTAYVQEMGFTHVELMPVMEHPYDGSWGYQVTGFYAATSRYGTPRELMYLIDRCHQAGIGVILDWVPGHFCMDAHGLGRFDGTPLFEREVHAEWGTYRFDFSRTEVWSFLISNALFWFDNFHADGLRVDGVTSMLFPQSNGDRERPGHPDNRASRQDPEAIAFLVQLHRTVSAYHPDVLMIAEESTDWPRVTQPPANGGLGFSYKWNMGWMNDTLRYGQSQFGERRTKHNLLTFSMTYAFAERFILPLSHDEVVHGKQSLIGRMPGDYWQKFAGLRVLYLYQLCHPGKKLLFMGAEIGQFIEWRYYEALEWFLLDYDMHRQFQAFVGAANFLYRRERSLWQNDRDWSGFEWIDVNNAHQGILIFLRRAAYARDFAVVILNFRETGYADYRLGVPAAGYYYEVLNTDAQEFGGSGRRNPGRLAAQLVPWHGRDFSVCITVPALGGVVLKLERDPVLPA